MSLEDGSSPATPAREDDAESTVSDTGSSSENSLVFDWNEFINEQKEIGRAIGHRCADLKKFVSAEVRAERQRQAEEKAAVRRERAAERAAVRREKMEHELQLKRLEQENQPAGPNRNIPNTPTCPRLERYNKKDPLDEYLANLETICQVYSVPEEEKVRQLYGLMPHDLVNVINQIPEEHRTTYSSVKEALLQAGHYTAEDLRQRYLQAYPTPQESGSMWGYRKMKLLKDWASRAKVKVAPEAQPVLDWWCWDAMVRLMPVELLTPVRNDLQGEQDLEKALTALDRVMNSVFPTKKICEVLMKPGTTQGITNPPSATGLGGIPKSNKKNKHKHKKNDNKTRIPDTRRPQDIPSGPPHASLSSHRQESHHRPSVGPPGHGSSHGKKGFTRSDQGTRHWSKPASRSLNGIALQDGSQETYDEVSVQIGSLAMGHASRVPTCSGQINGQSLTIVLDTGAEGIFVDKKFVQDNQYTGDTVLVRFVEGEPVRRPVACVDLKCAYYNGKAPVIALENPVSSMFLGRVRNLMPAFDTEAYDQAIADWRGDEHSPVATSSPEFYPEVEEYQVAPVSTRATSREEAAEPIPEVLNPQPLCNREEFGQMQSNDASLKQWWDNCHKEKTLGGKGGTLWTFVKRDNLLHRVTTTAGKEEAHLVIPASLRKQVMYMGHQNPLSGHFGLAKTLARIQKYFCWPGLTAEVNRYVRSCRECQMTSQARTPPQPMGITKLAATPFSRVAVDIVGPLQKTRSGKQYILTYVDMATRYPDAVPLGSIESEKVAEALLQICSRVGFPEVLTSDNGSNFTSRMFEAFLRLLEVDHIRTSVYHSMGNGACERYNGTLIRCLRKLVYDFPSQWDKYLPAALFAYRDTAHDTTGYAPFELIYGHHVRGPLEFLKECWECDTLREEDQDIHQYITKFAHKLRTAWKAAFDALQTSQTKSKALFDRHARRRLLRPGEKVLLLLPGDMRKMLLRWQGPYTVVKRYDPTHYSVLVNGAERKFHLNQLKRFHLREEQIPIGQQQVAGKTTEGMQVNPSTELSPNRSVVLNAAVWHYDAPDFPLIEEDPICPFEEELCSHHQEYGEERVLHLATALAIEDSEPSVDDGRDPSIPTGGSQTYRDVTFAPTLTQVQKERLQRTLAAFEDVLTDIPGLTNALEHDIVLKDGKPFMHKYAMPHTLQQQLKEDLKTWVRLGIVERSSSPYCSPLLAVRKKDGSHRFCLDCRQLNARTVFDGEPIADPAHIFSTLAPANYLTKMDLASGFWQVPLTDRAKPLTAFSTREGLYQFRVMPFGLVSAPGNFSRLMRVVLGDVKDVAVYIDDILIHSVDFDSHCRTLQAVLERLRHYGLHLKPSKCEIGFSSLQYLGHFVGEGRQMPIEEKVTAIVELPVPRTVTQLRSFLGSINYYQQYIQHCNVIAAPLHALLKGNPSKKTVIEWTDEAERAFVTLKHALAKKPVLQLVNAELPFTLQTDASDEGIGAVLLQARLKQPCSLAPVFYASRTLKKSERNYSTIEKEALAIYWACRKFEPYLYGRSFTLQTDHAPLVHLQTADKLNPRLKRWALYLALFAYRAEHIPGSSNSMADLLSRGTHTSEPPGERRAVISNH